jgi:hypothetical protein
VEGAGIEIRAGFGAADSDCLESGERAFGGACLWTDRATGKRAFGGAGWTDTATGKRAFGGAWLDRQGNRKRAFGGAWAPGHLKVVRLRRYAASARQTSPGR